MVAVKRPTPNPRQTARRARAKLGSAQIDYITREEGVALLDRQARKYLNMSGAEFREKFCSGELTYNDHPDVVRVAMLMHFSDD